ncbi:SAF domain-containing protein [Streptomyces monticola]|uniref:SAF domain-containing protein n=1 Tax=Streptomyces monticola TaxID=2666263 RepID=A0ABW2JMA2_9ACTN
MSSSAPPASRRWAPGGPERRQNVPTGSPRRKPGWIIGGAAVVAACAVVVAVLTSAAGRRDTVLVVVRDLPAGHVLQRGDLRTAEVAADSGVVPASRARDLAGRVLRMPLAKGALLAPGVIGSYGVYPGEGRAEVAVPLDPGAAPPRLQEGQHAYLTTGPDTTTDAKEDADKRTDGVMGIVSGVRKPESAGAPRVVTLIVETGAAQRAVKLPHPRLVVLPAEGRQVP